MAPGAAQGPSTGGPGRDQDRRTVKEAAKNRGYLPASGHQLVDGFRGEPAGSKFSKAVPHASIGACRRTMATPGSSGVSRGTANPAAASADTPRRVLRCRGPAAAPEDSALSVSSVHDARCAASSSALKSALPATGSARCTSTMGESTSPHTNLSRNSLRAADQRLVDAVADPFVPGANTMSTRRATGREALRKEWPWPLVPADWP